MMPRSSQELTRELYDIRGERNRARGGDYEGDFYGLLRDQRAIAPVHAGSVARLLDAPYEDHLCGEDRPHFAALDWETCNIAFRDSGTFSSGSYDIRASAVLGPNLLAMGGEGHKRHRALVHHKFIKKHAVWWVDRWIRRASDLLIDGFAQRGHADLNLELCAQLPLYTITGSFGIPDEQALEYSDLVNRLFQGPAALEASDELAARLAPIVAKRRAVPRDDLISALVVAEVTAEDGSAHQLADEQVLGFARLLIAAGLGTTWRQLGIVLHALLSDPANLQAVREDRSLITVAIEEAMRWEANDPIMRRLVTQDTELGGVSMPSGSILEICLGAANHDPARWQHPDPDRFDLRRDPRPHMAFGGGPHVCLGMHVARAEMRMAIERLLDRLPQLRLDPDAPPPQIVGYDHRAVTELSVVWD